MIPQISFMNWSILFILFFTNFFFFTIKMFFF